MKKTDYDILVVGAGPAGATAALAAALEGARVVMVDRKDTVGVPVRCAEYIPAPLLGELDLGRTFIVQKTNGMKTYLPGGEIKETRAPGFTIHRDAFDQALAHAAVHAGATLNLSTRVISYENGHITLKRRDGRYSQICPKIIIGADGPHSTVGKWAGLVSADPIPAIQASVALRAPLELTEVYFEKAFIGGYGWLFPKGERANAGVGFRSNRNGTGSLKSILLGFVEKLREEHKIKGQPLGYTFGWIPVQPLQKLCWKNMILAGDAAGHTHPITGAGIIHAVIAGRKAGTWAARASKAGDLGILNRYQVEWFDFYGDTLKKAALRRQRLETEWHQLDKIIKTCWVAFREYHAESA